MEAWIKKAVMGSIEKWEDILYRNVPDGGATDCPLCQHFNAERNGKCSMNIEKAPYFIGCPVFVKTGETACRGTPYDAWDDFRLEDAVTHEHYHPRKIVDNNQEQLKIAKDMVNFLKSLLLEENVEKGEENE
jgi:hypothetical protein